MTEKEVKQMKTYLTKLTTDESGQGMTEYALIIALVSVAIIAGLIAFRNQIAAVFTAATAGLQNR